MKQRTFDPSERVIAGDWRSGMRSGDDGRARDPCRWMTTLPAPLAEARRCALQALTEMNATLAYLYENEEKVVVRCTLPERQIRAELKPVDGESTRMVVVTMHGPEVDRATSGRIIEAIERKLSNDGDVLRP